MTGSKSAAPELNETPPATPAGTTGGGTGTTGGGVRTVARTANDIEVLEVLYDDNVIEE